MATYPYRARAQLKYKPPPGSTGGLVLAKGDLIHVLAAEDEDGDYLKGRKDDGTEGIFPEQFIERIEDDEAAAESEPTTGEEPVVAAVASSLAPHQAAAAPPPPAASSPAPSPAVKPASARAPAAAPSAPAAGGEDRPMSFKERLAAFNKPAAAPPPITRAKPTGYQRKPTPAPPPPVADAPTVDAPTSAPGPAASSVASEDRAGSSAAPSGMSAEDAASSISAGGGLKARIAALQSLKLDTPAAPGRPPKPWRKPTAPAEAGDDTPMSPTDVSEAKDDDVKVADESAPVVSEPSQDSPSPVERVAAAPIGAPPSMAMPAVPRRAGPPRRKAPSATTAVDPAVSPASEEPKTDPVPLESDDSVAPRDGGHMASDPAADVPADVNRSALGAASEEPGADLEAEAAGLEDGEGEQEVDEQDDEGVISSHQDRPPALPAAALRPPPPPRPPSSSDEEDQLADDDEPTSPAKTHPVEPVFRDVSDDEDAAVVPAFTEDQLDDEEDGPGQEVEIKPTADDGRPPPTPPIPQRSVPSPRGPRAFGSVSDGATTEAAPAPPPAALRPPPIPAPFQRQLTDEPATRPAVVTGRVPLPPRQPSTDGEDDEVEEVASPREPPSRKMSVVSVEETADAGDEQPVEDEVDPEIARRQALAKRMAALGGVKIGMVPTFGRPPPPPRQTSQDAEEAKSPVEEAVSPPRRTGLPAGAVPMFGMPMPPRRPPSPEPEAETESAERTTEHPVEATSEPEEEPTSPRSRPPSMPPPPRSAPSIPPPIAPEGSEDDDEVPAPPPPPRPTGGHGRPSLDEDRPPVAPPRPTGGHASRGSMDSTRSPKTSMDLPRPFTSTYDEARSPPVRQPSQASSTGHRSRDPSAGGLPMVTPHSPIDATPFSAFTSEPQDVHAEPHPLPSLPEGAGAAPASRQSSRPAPTPAELGDLSERIGASLHSKALRRAKDGTARYETGVGFVSALIGEIPEAAPPPAAGPHGGFGFCLWSSAAQSADQATMVRPGDILTTEGGQGVKLKGKGLGGSSVVLPAGYAAVVVEDYDAKKRKVRVVEVAEKGGKLEVASHHLDTIKSGTLAVYRVLDRSFA